MNPWTVVHQAPLSVGILQATILEGVAMPSSRGSPNPGIELKSPALHADVLHSEPPEKPFYSNILFYICWCHKACVRLDSQLDDHRELPARWKQTPALRAPSRCFVKDTTEKSWHFKQIWEDGYQWIRQRTGDIDLGLEKVKLEPAKCGLQQLTWWVNKMWYIHTLYIVHSEKT